MIAAIVGGMLVAAVLACVEYVGLTIRRRKPPRP